MLKRLMPTSLIAALLVGATVNGPTPAQTQESKSSKPHIDLAFCIDTTGSMASEIDNVKTKTKEIVAKLAGGKPSPLVRVALVAYRDRGDEYVTKTFPFSDDVDQVVKDISSLAAAGGGDTPESVNEAMHVAVNDLKWDSDKKTLKLLFLIGDAGPHQYPHDYNWRTEAQNAIARGIQVNTIGCGGIEGDGGEPVFKEIAHLAEGRYEPLSYRQEIAHGAESGRTIISSGGRMFKVKTEDKEAWRAGAAALAKAGAAEAIATSAPVSPSARPSGLMMRAMLAAPGGSAGGGGGTAYDAMTVSRRDNNLADMVLLETKTAAQKKLGIEFKTK